MKVLNAYAGIGGNRKLWPNDLEITAIELNPQIAKIYQDFWPDDKVIVTDAHQYILDHFQEFDFIWSSPPCQTHSKFRFMTTKMRDEGHKRPRVYPDMKLYEEIIFLQHYSEDKFVVENVVGYYEPLIKPTMMCGRHYFWSNFSINFKTIDNRNFIKSHIKDLERLHDIDISKYKVDYRKDQILRNCVNPKLGKHIFDCAFKGYKKMTDFMVMADGSASQNKMEGFGNE